MSVPPHIHASHLNTYSHGSGTTKTSSRKKPLTSPTNASAGGASSSNSSNSSSHSNSVQNSARDRDGGDRSEYNMASPSSRTVEEAGRSGVSKSSKDSRRSSLINPIGLNESQQQPASSPTRAAAVAAANVAAAAARGEIRVGPAVSASTPTHSKLSSSKSSFASSTATTPSNAAAAAQSAAAAAIGKDRDMLMGIGDKTRSKSSSVSSSTNEAERYDRERATYENDHSVAAANLGDFPAAAVSVKRENRIELEAGAIMTGNFASGDEKKLKSKTSATASARSIAADDQGQLPVAGSEAVAVTTKPSKPSSSKKPTKAASKKKAAVLAEQVALTQTANQAAALLAEKKELEARIAAREARDKAEAEFVIRVAEAHHLTTEAESDELFVQERTAVLTKLEEAVYEAQEWDSYLACNPLPDVREENSLNGYVSTFRNAIDKVNPPHLQVAPTLEACEFTEKVVKELEKRIAQAREDAHPVAVEYCERYVYLLRELENQKLSDLTCRFLNRIDEYEAGETQAFTVAAQSTGESSTTQGVAFGLWVHNSSRTERIKRIEFSEMGLTIELPQSLQKSRTSIRAVRTNYDHVSVTRSAPQKLSNSTSGNIDQALNEGKSGIGADGQFELSSASVQRLGSAASSSRPTTRGTQSTAALLNALPTASLEEESLRDPISLFDFNTRPPPQDSRSHFVAVGDVFNLTQLLLPPPAKKLKSWILREMTPLERTLVIVPYPLEQDTTNSMPLTSSTPAAAQSAPLRLKFTVNPQIFMNDREPIFGFWDAGANQGKGDWKQEGISILNYDTKTREVSLSLATIKPFAVIQPRAFDFPYRSWSVAAVHDSKTSGYTEADPDDEELEAHMCRLEVTGSRFSIAIDLRGGVARLSAPSHPFLKKFRDEWTTPALLTKGLAEVGIFITPSDADATYCRKPVKHELLVQTLHEHVSLLTQVFDVTSSPHNVSRPTSAAVLRVRINKHSTLLRDAAKRRAIMDWQAQEEEDERADRPEKSWKNFPDEFREKSLAEIEAEENASRERKKNQDAIDAQIAEMEAEEKREAAEATRRAEVEAKRKADEEAAALAKQAADKKRSVQFSAPEPVDDNYMPPAPPLTTEQKHALGFEWATVLAELIDVPSNEPQLAQEAAQAANPSSKMRKATSARPLTSAEKAQGTTHEGLPAGVLLKFTLIRGEDKEGVCDTRPLPGVTSHFSLRRCLLEYFQDKTPHDLMTAMSMSRPNFGVGSQQTVLADSHKQQQYNFIPFDPLTLQTQQTVRRALNLTRPFVFC